MCTSRQRGASRSWHRNDRLRSRHTMDTHRKTGAERETDWTTSSGSSYKAEATGARTEGRTEGARREIPLRSYLRFLTDR